MIRAIISDLDGTLVHNHADIKQPDINALRRAAEAGITIAFASGRMHPEIETVAAEMRLRVHSISQNGAFVYTAEGTPIASHAFDPSLQRRIIEAGERTAFLNLLCAPDYYFVERMTPHGETIGSRLMAPLRVIEDARERLGRDLISAKMSFFGEPDQLRAFMAELKAEHGDRIDAYISDIDCMDVMPSGVSKGTGLAALLERLNITPDEALCIGDSFNDLSMFAATPHSYAMAGSHPDVRAKAAHVTTSVAEVVNEVLEGRVTAG